MSKKKIILGTAQLCNRYGISNNYFIDKKKSLDILDCAWTNGFRYFDTAQAYPSQKLIGDFVKSNNLSKEIKILTKIQKTNFEKIGTNLEMNIEELNTTPLITFLHNENDKILYYKNENKFEMLKKKGLTLHFGLSVYTEKNLKKYKNLFYQFPYNLLDTRFSKFEAVSDMCIARSVFLQGVLTKRIYKENIKKKFYLQIKKFQKIFFQLCADLNDSPENIAFNFMYKSNKFSKAIIGVESISQLKNLINLINNYEDNFVIKKEYLFLEKDWAHISDPRLWLAHTSK